MNNNLLFSSSFLWTKEHFVWFLFYCRECTKVSECTDVQNNYWSTNVENLIGNFDLVRVKCHKLLFNRRLRVVPHFSSEIVVFTRAHVSHALLSLRKNGRLLVVYLNRNSGRVQSAQFSLSVHPGILTANGAFELS